MDWPTQSSARTEGSEQQHVVIFPPGTCCAPWGAEREGCKETWLAFAGSPGSSRSRRLAHDMVLMRALGRQGLC